MRPTLPIVDYILVFVSDKRLLVSSLENMDSCLVDSQPKVLGQGGCVCLDDFKHCGPIEGPLLDEGHVRLITFLLSEVRVFTMFVLNVLWMDP